MSTESFKHLFLTQTDNQQQAQGKVLHFLDNTELIRYEATTIPEESIRRGDNPSFWTEIDKGIASNHRFTETLLVELKATGVSRLQDLQDLAQGYPSKILHTLVHVLDGFIGADSAFYNLLEDSHWLSDKLREAITKAPKEYWLVAVVPGRLTYSVFHPKGA